jgi:prevent-host-death family protein
MNVYSYSEARQRLAELLNRARREGQVGIRRRDGEAFVVRPGASGGSPLDVPGVDAGLSRQEIVDLVRKSRQSSERFLKGTTPPSKRLRPAARRARRD